MARQPRGAVQEKKSEPAVVAAPAPVRLSGEMITVPRGDREYRIPVEIYEGQDPNLTIEDVIALTDAAEVDKGDGRIALDGVGMLLTAFDQLRSELGVERRARKKLEQLVLAIAKEREEEEREIESGRSQELDQQLAEIGTAIANAGAVRVDLDNSADRMRREAENAEARIASAADQAAAPAEAARGSANAAVTLVNEAAGAIDDKIVEQHAKVSALEQRQEEVATGVEANRRTLKAATGGMLPTEVTAEVKAQLPALLDQELEEMRKRLPNGPFGAVLDRAYVDQTERDRINTAEARVGTDEAFRRTSSRSRR